MSEPRRWKDSPDAPVGMRELLGSARRSTPLDEATFRRGARRVASMSMAPAAAAVASFWTKLAAAGALGLATAGTIAAVQIASSNDANDAATAPPPAAQPKTSGPARTASPVAEPTPPVEPEPEVSPAAGSVAPVTTAPVIAAKAIGAPVVAARVARSTATTAPDPVATTEAAPWIPEEPSRPKSTLADELGLLERVRGHLARSPETALVELAQHRALYPAGALAAERDLMELDALRRTGRVQDARTRAQAWLARDPQGMHAARVRRILSTLE